MFQLALFLNGVFERRWTSLASTSSSSGRERERERESTLFYLGVHVTPIFTHTHSLTLFDACLCALHRSKDQEQSDRGETIATLWMIARSPLMHAGPLPADNITLGYETNAVALEAHAYGEPHVVGYQGNCRCETGADRPLSSWPPRAGPGKLGPGCTLNRTAFPACVAKWTSAVTPPQDASPWVAVAVINMGEVGLSL